MSKTNALLGIAACTSIAAFAGAFAARSAQDPGAQPPAFELPPGWTMEDMEACTIAGTPGEMHELLRESVGVWTGVNQMWMAPGMDPMSSDTTWKITSIMDGRFIKTEVSGDMPGMGPFNGLGLTGYDNTAEKFVGDWVDNHSTAIMRGTGELSSDGTTLTWKYSYTCPITKKPATMREIQRLTSEGAMTFEMFCTDPKSGQEYKCMLVELEKSS